MLFKGDIIGKTGDIMETIRKPQGSWLGHALMFDSLHKKIIYDMIKGQRSRGRKKVRLECI